MLDATEEWTHVWKGDIFEKKENTTQPYLAMNHHAPFPSCKQTTRCLWECDDWKVRQMSTVVLSGNEGFTLTQVDLQLLQVFALGPCISVVGHHGCVLTHFYHLFCWAVQVRIHSQLAIAPQQEQCRFTFSTLLFRGKSSIQNTDCPIDFKKMVWTLLFDLLGSELWSPLLKSSIICCCLRTTNICLNHSFGLSIDFENVSSAAHPILG